MMIAALSIVGAVVAFMLLLLIVGTQLPKEHVAARSAVIHKPRSEVFAVVHDHANSPSWRGDVKKVQTLPDRDGKPMFLETSGFGDMLFEVTEVDAPKRRVTTIADESQGFGGQWIYELTEVEGGCRVTVTERGKIHNPLFRALSKYVFGHETTMNRYLQALGKKFGEDVKTEPASPAS